MNNIDNAHNAVCAIQFWNFPVHVTELSGNVDIENFELVIFVSK